MTDVFNCFRIKAVARGVPDGVMQCVSIAFGKVRVGNLFFDSLTDMDQDIKEGDRLDIVGHIGAVDGELFPVADVIRVY